jgi:hypothetical protein
MPIVFSDVKVNNQGGDSDSIVSLGYVNGQKLISKNSVLDVSFNSLRVNKITGDVETNVISLDKNCSMISGTSNVLPNGNEIGFEKVLINSNENAIEKIYTGSFGEFSASQVVHSVTFDNDGNMYVGGLFQMFKDKIVNNIFRYNTDGTVSRCGMGTGTSGNVSHVLWDPSYNRLYVGVNQGVLNNANGTTFNCNGMAIYYPDTDTWSGFGTNNKFGGTGGSSSSNEGRFLIDYTNNFLYVTSAGSGIFNSLGGVSVKCAARVNRANLTNITSVVSTLTFSGSTRLGDTGFHQLLLDSPNNALYVCGQFTGNGNGATGQYSNLIKIDITTVPSSTILGIGVTAGASGPSTGGVWGSTSNPVVRSMVMIGDDIYFAGNFNRTPSAQYTGNTVGHLANARSLQRFAKFNKNTLVITPINLEDHVPEQINSLAYDSALHKIVMAGNIPYVGNFETRGICWYDVSSGKYEQLTYGFNSLSGSFSPISNVYIRNNKYIVCGLFIEPVGSDTITCPYLCQINTSNLNNIYGSIGNNSQNLSSIQMQYKGQILRLIWNGTKWCVDNYMKI